MIYTGKCHCGAVAFEVDAPEKLRVLDCNCSICAKAGFLHLIVPKEEFRLLRGAGNLTTYTFNTGVAKHTFCRTCGMKPFYTPRSHPDGVDVNVRCLEPIPDDMVVERFDGRNWEASAAAIAAPGAAPAD
jgi:hypothetical protein